MSGANRIPGQGPSDACKDRALHLRRQELYGARRRYRRLGAARQRRASRRPFVQVSPAARHPVGRRRRAERADRRFARRCPQAAERARHGAGSLRRHDRRARRTAGRRSPSMSARSTICCRRSLPPASTTRPSCGRSAAWKHVYEPLHPPCRRSRRRADGRRSGPLFQPLCPLRRAGGRRRRRRAFGGACRGRRPAPASSSATSRRKSAVRCTSTAA